MLSVTERTLIASAMHDIRRLEGIERLADALAGGLDRSPTEARRLWFATAHALKFTLGCIEARRRAAA
jgi:hypothetical protein